MKSIFVYITGAIRTILGKTISMKALTVLLSLIALAGALIRPTSMTAIYAQTPQPPFYLWFPYVSRTDVMSGPEIYTTSYYIRTSDPSVSYQRGCELGTRDKNLEGTQLNMSILAFGKPVKLINGEPGMGTKLFFTTRRITIAQIEESAYNFALGYYVCTGSDQDSKLIVAIGTNNYQDDENCDFCGVVYEHGRAWAEMVNTVNDRLIAGGYAGQVSAVGANDIELAWNTYERTRDWINGYDSANRYELINFGALEGCPYFSAPGAKCAPGWDRDKAWYVAWGAPPVFPVPEIYANNGVNAQQWYLMSLYSAESYGTAMIFRGVLTQYQACQATWNSGAGKYNDASCEYLDNTPKQGWEQLQSLVNGNDKTRHQIIYSTDIRW